MDEQGVANTASGLAKTGASSSLPLWLKLMQRSLRLSREFKPQGLSSLLWALATVGVPPDPALVQALSSEAVSKARDFKPLQIVKVMWALATSGVSPDPALVQAMSSEAVAKAKKFIAQDIANLMWALGTSGVSPNPALVKAMSSEAVSKAKDFTPQNVANLLWALATMDAPQDSVLVREMLAKFVLCDFDAKGQLQLHIFFLSNSIAPHPLDLFSWADLASACKAAFLAGSSSHATSSKLQKDVARSLRKIVSQDILEEQVLQDSGYSVDIRLADSKVIVEVDGPSHYLRGAGQERMMDGSTQCKARILRQLGWTVVRVPYFDWDALSDADSSLEIAAKTRYLSALLADAGVAVAASAQTTVA
jgi:hypothetical protein